jgi:hypothetical protein
MSKQFTLRKAITSVAKDRTLHRKWISADTLEKAIRVRYDFGEHFEFTTRTLSLTLGHLPSVDILTLPNDNGIYRGKNGDTYYYYINNPKKQPPLFPNPRDLTRKEIWESIVAMDLKLQESIKFKEDRMKRKDPPVHDDVDTILNQESIKAEARKIFESKPKKGKWEKVDYWCSTDAVNLFMPMAGETVLDCLARRDRLLKIRKRTTKGWQFELQWNDGTTSWTKMQEIRILV